LSAHLRGARAVGIFLTALGRCFDAAGVATHIFTAKIENSARGILLRRRLRYQPSMPSTLEFLMKRIFCLTIAFAATVFINITARAADMADLSETRIKPPYANAPELTPKENVPKGVTHDFTMDSGDSKSYPGLRGHYVRNGWVYVPAQYVPGTAAPFIVVQDGQSYLKRLPPILDNMIAEKRLPVMIAVLLHHGGGDGKGSERGLEYDTMSAKYADFVETEVLPRLEKDYNIKFTKDPDGRATMGGSSGAAAAFSMAWYRPELYRKVLSYSGTFVNQQSPTNEETPHGAWEYHEHLIPQNDPKPIRIWMEVGENDNGAKSNEASLHNWVMANDRMAAALKAKGYQYRYVFAEGARHVDGGVVNQTLPEALEWLWKGYPIK
jgi:iron(III)-enterobactin esterase